MTHEWADYAVGPTGGDICTEFTAVSHTAHLSPATAIVREGQIRAGLVYDKSRLNESRTLVVWVSPNYWNDGFIYGGVQFVFDWEPLVAGKFSYYVETMKEYKPHACRILITDVQHPELTPYDPTRRDGPWWKDPSTGTHHYHGRTTLEFMLETSLATDSVREFDFQAHHEQICNVHDHARFCPEAKLTREAVRARFLATILGERLAAKAGPLVIGEGTDRRAGDELLRGWYDTENRLLNLAKVTGGPIGQPHPAAAALARAIFFRYGHHEFEDVMALAALFSSAAELKETLRTEAESAFDLPSGDLLRDS